MTAHTQGFHGVHSVKADYYMPDNANCVTFAIERDGGRHAEAKITLYFGNRPGQAERARAFFDALGGMDYQIVENPK